LRVNCTLEIGAPRDPSKLLTHRLLTPSQICDKNNSSSSVNTCVRKRRETSVVCTLMSPLRSHDANECASQLYRTWCEGERDECLEKKHRAQERKISHLHDRMGVVLDGRRRHVALQRLNVIQPDCGASVVDCVR
jgi:hypothetical protein